MNIFEQYFKFLFSLHISKFRTSTTTGHSILSHPYRSKDSKNLLGHIEESYDFIWNADSRFMLEDNKDSIIYGELVVSPPPSGYNTYFAL